ncbi:MAG: HPP family protein [Gemmatimonadota bacterium]
MNDILRWTAADVMQRDVIAVSPDAPVAELLDLLQEEGISGVPVVGPDETVLGVVSLSDVARAASEEASTGKPPPRRARDPGRNGPSSFFRLPDGALSALPPSLPRSKLGSRSVRDIMTPATLTLRPDASLVEVARFLDRAGVHRALVMDGSVLAGIVTTLDVVRALARSSDQA